MESLDQQVKYHSQEEQTSCFYLWKMLGASKIAYNFKLVLVLTNCLQLETCLWGGNCFADVILIAYLCFCFISGFVSFLYNAILNMYTTIKKKNSLKMIVPWLLWIPDIWFSKKQYNVQCVWNEHQTQEYVSAIGCRLKMFQKRLPEMK